MSRTVWLASYPKSGNTWFRLFMARLLRPDAALDINRMALDTPIASGRGLLDDWLGFPSALLGPAEIDSLRPECDRHLRQTWAEPLLLRKTHDGYNPLEDRRPLMGQGPDFAAIYLLRDPWDVAVSMSNHFSCSLARAVERLQDASFTMASSRRGLDGQLAQRLGTWEAHAIGWLRAPLDLHLLQYEDMRADPLPIFRGAVRFLGLDHDDQAIEAALEACRFDRLQEQEQALRFREAPTNTRQFFRSGQVGEGLTRLDPAALQDLRAMHDRVETVIAERFGYA
jgi:hypothetical protein